MSLTHHYRNAGQHPPPSPHPTLYCTESGASMLQRAPSRRGMNTFHQRRNEKPFCLPIQPCPPSSLSLPTSLPPPVRVFVVVVAPSPPPPQLTLPLHFLSLVTFNSTHSFLPGCRGAASTGGMFQPASVFVCLCHRVCEPGAGQQRGGRKGSIHVCIL